MPQRQLAAALLAAALHAGCNSVPCDDRTITTSASPDAAYTASVVHRDCGTWSGVLAIFRVERKRDDDTNEVFALRGPFTATFTWPEPRVLRVVVKRVSDDGPKAWAEIESQIEEMRTLGYGDLRVEIGTARQFDSGPIAAPR